MPLEALPFEILTQIFEEIAGADQWSGWGYGVKYPLANLSLSCRRFYNVAQPILYNELWVGGLFRRLGIFHGFLRAVASRPSSTRYISRFTCTDTPPGVPVAKRSGKGLLPMNDPSHLSGVMDLSEQLREWMRTSLPDDVYGRVKCDEWHEALISGSWDAMLAFLLHLFSRSLQEIKLIVAFPMGQYTELVLNTAIKEQSGEMFSNLRKVRLGYDRDVVRPHRGLRVSFTLPFIRLKSVTSITIHGLQEDSSAASMLENEYCTSVTELNVTNSRATPGLIRSFLLCFHSLKSFHYSHAPSDPLSEGSRPQLGPAEIVQGLAHSMHCIESLEISKDSQLPWTLNSSSQYEISADDKYGPIDSMTSFGSLRKIYIDPYILLGVERPFFQMLGADYSEPPYSREQCETAIGALPNTVVSLEIRKCKRSIFSFLESLLPEFGPCRLPSLKNITLYFTMKEESRLTKTLLDDWERRSTEKGVNFEQIPVPRGQLYTTLRPTQRRQNRPTQTYFEAQ